MLALFDRLLDFLSPKIKVETLHTSKTFPLSHHNSCIVILLTSAITRLQTAKLKQIKDDLDHTVRYLLIGIEVLTIGLCLVCIYTL